MRLLFLLPEYVGHGGGGIITFYRTLLPALAASGHQVRVLVGSGVSCVTAPRRHCIDGVAIEELDAARVQQCYARLGRYAAFPTMRRMLAGAWAMWEQAGADRMEVDLVEAADWGLLFLPAVIEGGAPALVQLHGSVGQIDLHDPVRGEEAQGVALRLLEAMGVRLAAGAQAYSALNASDWQQQTARPVDCVRPAWRPVEPQLPAAPRGTRGLVVGRVQQWKGPQLLCEALRLLDDQAPEIDWVGRDTAFGSRALTTTAYLEQEWGDVWGRAIRHQPQVSFETAARLQASAAFVVVPSLWDTFNFTCVEAMAAQTPAICSSAAGASELIEDGVNGFVFQRGDAGSLAAALERTMALSAPERAAMGHRARQTVLDALDPDTICQQRIARYEALVRQGPRPALPESHWLRMACAPESHAGSDASLPFLDHLPLRAILGHAGARLLRKIKG